MRGSRRAAVSALLAKRVRIARHACGGALTLLLALSPAGAAQQAAPVYFDGSLGFEGPALSTPDPVDGVGVEYQIDYCPSCGVDTHPFGSQGELVGTSLFQSLRDIDVPTDDAARFAVSEPGVSVNYVFARITSGQETHFDGDLRSDLDADIYLLNPYGLVFGAGSQIDVKGTFYVSSADELHFDDGKTFEARADGLVPAIEVGAPSSFGFLLDDTPPARILFDSDRGLLPHDASKPEQLGRSLTAVAGRIEVEDDDSPGASAGIESYGGQIKLAAAPAGSEVPVDVESVDVDTLASDDAVVRMARNSSISVSGSGPSGPARIVIRAGRFETVQPSVAATSAALRSRNTGAGTQDAPAIDVEVAGAISLDHAVIESVNGGTPGGDIRLVGDAVELRSGSDVETRIGALFKDAPGSDIHVEATTLDVQQGSKIQTRDDDNGITWGKVGDITVLADQVNVSGSGSAISTRSRGTGDGATIRVEAGDVTLDAAAQISANRLKSALPVAPNVPDDGGAVQILAESLNVLDRSEIVSSTSTNIDGASIQIGSAEKPVANLAITDGAIGTVTTAAGAGGNVDVYADSVALDRTLGSADVNPQISALTTRDAVGGGGNGPGGNLTIHAGSIRLENGSQLRATTQGGASAPGGALTLVVDGLLSAHGSFTPPPSETNPDPDSIPSGVFAKSERSPSAPGVATAGQGGHISIAAQAVELTAGAEISAAADGTGAAGNLDLVADRVLVQGDPETHATSSVSVRGTDAAGGDLRIAADQLQVYDRGIITASTSGIGQSGNLEIVAREVDVAGAGSGVFAQSNLENIGAGRAGAISLAPPEGEQLTLRVRDGALLSVQSVQNAAGSIEIADAALVEVTNGGEVSAKVNNVALQPGEDSAALASDIRIVDADRVRMSQATMTAETSGTGTGGSIAFQNVGDVFLSDGSSITTKSTAENAGGAAGDIVIAATGSFQSENSSITTTAENAGGGRISIQAGDLVYLYESLLETTVNGADDVAGADAGDIDIPLRGDEASASLQRLAAASPQADGGLVPVAPEFVVLNGSVIRANANATNAGNITIDGANVFISSDSLIEATSRTGLSGAIQISAPDADIASKVTVLPSNFVDPSDRLLPPCVARTERTGSFMVQNREALPRPLDAPLSSSLADVPATGGIPPASGSTDCSVLQERS
jgi:filamentous hemagglutinin family protein